MGLERGEFLGLGGDEVVEGGEAVGDFLLFFLLGVEKHDACNVCLTEMVSALNRIRCPSKVTSLSIAIIH